ncbi:MAG: glycosyltransferase [Gammaproteobacteria bacterium]
MAWIAVVLAVASALIWWGILLAPWRPWSTRERFEVGSSENDDQAGDVTVLIPARDKAELLPRTLAALTGSGRAPRIIVIDDHSGDDTAALARAAGAEVITAAPLPAGWNGKLWALEQGRVQAVSRWLLLLDADIELAPGVVPALKAMACHRKLQLVSLMAWLRMAGFWEQLLMPAFVFFFKLLYPFKLANSPSSRLAAAAGGCILVESQVLAEIGGFGALRSELIDDCALARAVKARGHATWIGLTHAATSQRTYDALASIFQMVARSAFTQLRNSITLLGLCSLLLLVACWVPIAGLFFPMARWAALCAWLAMAASYLPTLRFYQRSPWWCLGMPLIGTLYLSMTWYSAWRHWSGTGARWKGRDYQLR